MQYAQIGTERREAFPGGRGVCPICGSATIAKCGSRVIHHWAHATRKDCDPWWENETNWHRDWKNLFPEECREISYTASDGEIHRADLVTPTGIVIEFQHSQMSDEERLSRESFYKNLVWVVDGSEFRKNFDIYHQLPHPTSELTKDIRWFKATREKKGAAHGMFWRLSERGRTIAWYGFTAYARSRRKSIRNTEDIIYTTGLDLGALGWMLPVLCTSI